MKLQGSSCQHREFGICNVELGVSFPIHAGEDEMKFPGFAI